MTIDRIRHAPTAPRPRRAALHAGQVIAVAIVAFWLAMMFALVKDSILPRRQAIRTFLVDTSALGEEWVDVDEFYRIVTDQSIAGAGAAGWRQIGGARVTIERTARPVGFRAHFALRLGLRLLQRPLGVTIRAAVQLDDAFELADFNVRFEGLKARIHLEGSVINDERILLRFRAGTRGEAAEPRRLVFPISGPISLLDAVRPLALRDRDIQVGDAYMVEVIDPIWQMSHGNLVMTAEGEETIDVGGVQHRAIRMRNEFAGQLTASWVAPDGRLLRREIMPGRGLYMEAALSSESLLRFHELFDGRLDIERLPEEEFASTAPTSLDALSTLSLFADLDIIPEIPTR